MRWPFAFLCVGRINNCSIRMRHKLSRMAISILKNNKGKKYVSVTLNPQNTLVALEAARYRAVLFGGEMQKDAYG